MNFVLILKKAEDYFKGLPLGKVAVQYVKNFKITKYTIRDGAVLLVLVSFFVYINGIRPPSDFPQGVVVTVPTGESVATIAERLESRHVIPSAEVFRLILVATNLDNGVIAGDYVFAEPKNIFYVARALTKGDFGLAPVKVTIPEGSTSYEIAEILETKLGTDPKAFLEIAEKSEGFLFPDTYYFLPNAKPENIARALQDTFFEKVEPYQDELLKQGKTLHEVVTMASLLEKEAYTEEQRKNISAILWRRIDIDMLLQVDAVFGYIYKRPTFHPRYSHLAVDSPYNTYKYKGLPAGPISNPGLVSIEAALAPADNEFLYYLSDRSGNMHYSKKYEEHVQKKNKYLN